MNRRFILTLLLVVLLRFGTSSDPTTKGAIP